MPLGETFGGDRVFDPSRLPRLGFAPKLARIETAICESKTAISRGQTAEMKNDGTNPSRRRIAFPTGTEDRPSMALRVRTESDIC